MILAPAVQAKKPKNAVISKSLKLTETILPLSKKNLKIWYLRSILRVSFLA